jgi:hypothetical protein
MDDTQPIKKSRFKTREVKEEQSPAPVLESKSDTTVSPNPLDIASLSDANVKLDAVILNSASSPAPEISPVKLSSRTGNFLEKIKKAVPFAFFTSSSIGGQEEEKLSFFDKIKKLHQKNAYNEKPVPLAFLKGKGYSIEHKDGAIRYFEKDAAEPIFYQTGGANPSFRVGAQCDPTAAAKHLLNAAHDMKFEKLYVNGSHEVKQAFIDEYVSRHDESAKPVVFVGNDAKQYNKMLKTAIEKRDSYESSLANREKY